MMMMMMIILMLMMMMMTRAGKAVANFTLNVVVPVPPKPPQDVVEERFQKEYLIAIGVAAVIVRYPDRHLNNILICTPSCPASSPP